MASASDSDAQDKSSWSIDDFCAAILKMIPIWFTVRTGKSARTCETFVDKIVGPDGKILYLRPPRYQPRKIENGEIAVIYFRTIIYGYGSEFQRGFIYESKPVIHEGRIISFGEFTQKKAGNSFPVSVTTAQPPGIEIGIPKLFESALVLHLQAGKTVYVKVHSCDISGTGQGQDYPNAKLISVGLDKTGKPDTITIIPVNQEDYVVVKLSGASVSDAPIPPIYIG